MKKILILMLLAFISCEIEYDGETKLVIKGTVKNQDNQSISNQDVKLFVSRNSSYLPFVFYYPSESNFIGTTSTDEFGNFTMVIPKPNKNYSEIIVEVNDDSNSLNAKRIVNIVTENFENFELNFGTFKLYSKSDLCQLNIRLNQINPENEILKIEFEGDIANEIIYYNQPEDYNYYYETNKNIKKNQTIILKYTVKNHLTNTTSIEENLIQIDNSNEINYTLNY
jgi:hypothetical protein